MVVGPFYINCLQALLQMVRIIMIFMWLGFVTRQPNSSMLLSITSAIPQTKVRSRSLCTWENRNNFRITGSVYKIHGPERSPGPFGSFDISILAIGPRNRKLAVLP